MFGLEEKQTEPFLYDIEKKIRKDPKNAKEMLERIAKHKHEIKEVLRKGDNKKEFDSLTKLVEGYDALEIVINRIKKSK